MNKSEKTHIIYDGKKIIISENLKIIFSFLSNISNEIESLLNIDTKISNLKDGYIELLEFSQVLLDKVEKNNINFIPKFTSEKMNKTIKEFDNFQNLTRIKFIALFSYIEVLYCINLSYKNEVYNAKKIIDLAMNKQSSLIFLKNYILNENNEYYKSHHKRFSKISAKKIRELRNLLVHFFSTHSSIIINADSFNDKARIIEDEFEKNGRNDVNLISPNDLYNLIKETSKIFFSEWTKDYKENPKIFKKKILCTKILIDEIGALTILEKHFKFD